MYHCYHTDGFMTCFDLASRLLAAAFIAAAIPPADAQISKPSLRASQVLTNGWFQLLLENPEPDVVYAFERGADLSSWEDAGVAIGPWEFDGELPFTDAANPGREAFYRVRAFQRTNTNDWKNLAVFPYDSFLAEPVRFGQPEVRWIKFAITTNEPARVYYQDTRRFPFHYNFAAARLPEFKGMSAPEFDEVSLYPSRQKLVLGTLLFAPVPETAEVGIQFVGMEPYTPERIADLFEVVRASVASEEPLKALYIPTHEQAATAEQNKEFFETRGIEVANLGRWDTGQSAYSLGWAIGTLKYFPSAMVDAAYASGELRPEDILLTDSVPAELPYLAGILTLTAATPNSHVAILARSYGVPFAWLAKPEQRALAESLTGKVVAVSAAEGYGGSDVRILDLSGVDPMLREDIMALKSPPEIEITPKAAYGAYMVSTEELTPADIQFVGGKAANFGFLRRSIPENSPVAFAITFDLWDEFMEQALFGGKTLREEIDARLNRHFYPPDVGAVKADLAWIRAVIEDSTSFTQAQRDAIIQFLLAHFDPQRKIRFRSSTNVEDSETFTGAGLYDSYSGCLADDVDGDGAGPSICEPEEDNERGVFRAIRKVYASFYNDNAFLERLRHGVNEEEVGMAVLVHYSNPDPTEMANGVATVAYEKTPEGRTYLAEMVTQEGAVSVANPDNTAIPEVVEVSQFFSPFASTRQWSSLLPYGAHVLEWDDEYLAFAELFSRIAGVFGGYYPEKANYTLDFEYKKIVPGSLLVKQVRELPRPEEREVTRFLVNDPEEWCVFQGEFGDVFANHRLKTRLMVEAKNQELTQENLSSSLFQSIQLQYADGGEVKELAGDPAAFPGYEHEVNFQGAFALPVIDSWEMPGTNPPRRLILTANVEARGPVAASPILTLPRTEITLSAEYEIPVTGYNNFGKLGPVTNELVRLVPCPATNSGSIHVTRTASAGPGTNVAISLFWPPPPAGPTAGYTAPLAAWDETVITGLTSEPIVLRGYWSQTYRPGHHNFSEEFLFEPRLENGISPELIAELEAKDIQQIHVFWGGIDFPSRISVRGAALDRFRLLRSGGKRPL